MFHWSQLQLVYMSMLKDEASAADKLQSVALANKSLLQLSLSQENGSSVSRKFRHPCLRRLHFLLASLVSEIGAQFQNLRFIDNDSCHVVMQHFRWLQCFVRVCRRPVGSRTSKECVSEIAVHWQWLYRKLIMSLNGIGFQFSQQLKEVMQHLQLSFGIDEAAMKIQGTVRSLLGQPHPFHASSVADAFSEAYVLCCRLERQNDDSEVDHVKVNLRSDVQRMKLRLADSLMSLDQETVENCVSETKELSNILMMKCDVEEAELSTRVALYPVCQLVAEICEASFAADICNHIIPSYTEVSHFLSYCSLCTAVSPLTLCSFKFLLPSSVHKMGGFCVSRSLFVRSITTQTDGALPCVYAGMLCCNTSRQILSVLSASDDPSNSCSMYSCIPGDFTVGAGDSRCLQLSSLSRLLWTNAQLLCGSKCDPYKNDRRLLEGTFCKLISSLQSLLPAELRDILDDCLAATSTDMYADVSERVLAVAASSSKLMMLIPDWPSQLSDCLQRIGHLYLQADDRCMNAAMLGAAWVELGLFKMQLLAPRGSVDPSYRMAVKLEYAKEQLQCIEHNLKVHNWQAYLSTGQQLPTDCHPMIHRMCSQQVKLKQWISEKSELVAYRPELAQYLALLRDIRQFMCGLGSSERIRSLVKHLLKSFESSVPAVGAVEEFTTLRAAVSAFMSRIEQDYLLYCDIIVPFLTAVAETMHGVDLIVNSLQTIASRHRLYSAFHCKHGVLDDFVRRLVQFPVSCENLKSGSWHTMCGISFESLRKFDVCFESAVIPSQLQLRYVQIFFCCYLINKIAILQIFVGNLLSDTMKMLSFLLFTVYSRSYVVALLHPSTIWCCTTAVIIITLIVTI